MRTYEQIIQDVLNDEPDDDLDFVDMDILFDHPSQRGHQSPIEASGAPLGGRWVGDTARGKGGLYDTASHGTDNNVFSERQAAQGA